MTEPELPLLDPLRAEMCELIRAALAAGHEVSFCRSAGDSFWEVAVAPGEALTFKGYAADAYPATATLDTLDYTDLAYLSEDAATLLAA